MTTQTAQSNTSTALRFASALSRKTDTEAAVRDLADAVRSQMGPGTLDLAFVFFSQHHAGKADLIAMMVREELSIEVCLGCSGEGIIADGQELETAAALTLWVACLPQVHATPLRLAFSQTQRRAHSSSWPTPLRHLFTMSCQSWPSVIRTRKPSADWLAGVMAQEKIV